MKILRCIARGTLALGLALMLAGWQPARAEEALTFVVNSNGDQPDAAAGNGVCATSGGACTLRAAVQEANARAGTHTITIPAMTIVTGSTLVVTKGVTINGAGQGSTIIDGNNHHRVLKFDYYSGVHSVSNLTIRNANYNAADIQDGGGGIYNAVTLTVSNVTLSNNRANQGGGIFNRTAFIGGDNNYYVPSLTLNSVTFTGNTATSTSLGHGGGGLYNGGALSAQNITITGNTAQQGGGYYNNSYHPATLTNFNISSNSARYGGGINVDVGSVTLSNGQINNNSSTWSSGAYTGGAGIYNNDGTLSLTNVTLSGNTAHSPGGYGGGLYNWKYATLTNVTLSGNTAAFGAGIYNGNGDNAPNNMTLTNVTISGNLGRNNASPFIESVGAGIYNARYAQLTVTNSTITGNTAVAAGGIRNLEYATAAAALRNTILANNTATGAGYGPNCWGTIASNNNNLLGSTFGCTFSAKSGDLTNANPMLGSLQNNGGTTLTHALLAGSPAVDRGTNSGCPSTDQRGVARPVNGSGLGSICDMGAYEALAAAAPTNFIYVPLIVR